MAENPFKTTLENVQELFHETGKRPRKGAGGLGMAPVPADNVGSLVVKTSGAKVEGVRLDQYVEDLAERVKHIEGLGESAPKGALEEATKKLTKAGRTMDTHLHGVQEKIAEARQAVVTQHAKAVTGGSLKGKAVAEATAHYEATLAELDKLRDVAKGQRDKFKDIAKLTEEQLVGGSTEFKSIKEAAAGVGGAVSATGKAGKIFVGEKAAEALGVIGKAEYNKKTWLGKIGANVKANWHVSDITKSGEVIKSGPLGKGIKAGVVGLGGIIGAYGAKDLGQVLGVVSPDVDEQGKEIPVDSGKLIKSAAELGAAAAAVYFTLMKPGKAANLMK